MKPPSSACVSGFGKTQNNLLINSLDSGTHLEGSIWYFRSDVTSNCGTHYKLQCEISGGHGIGFIATIFDGEEGITTNQGDNKLIVGTSITP